MDELGVYLNWLGYSLELIYMDLSSRPNKSVRSFFFSKFIQLVVCDVAIDRET